MLACIQGDPLLFLIGIWILTPGVVGFLVVGIDKAKAIRGKWRVSETALIIIALAGGALGVGAGLVVFHHKTSKFRFLVVFVPILIAWLIILRQVGFLSCLATALP
jgi:uncharacterized membrane protein YsdA (DUF1294 family)